ncbi:sulfotransferase family protein [Tateyamaria sp.]|uniref:sulfotransferase family protein n=1 Tax=Tateyamaria sp. TaxID=1929288 RepID=UPI00329E1E6C
MHYPNLFVIGAPKCGTSALYKWLNAHHEIFVPRSKEPHHFSTEYCLTPRLSQYLEHYRDWTSKEKWALDASVWYLHSPTAIPKILEVRPDARFIVMLRKPTQMIPSMHQQQVLNGNEFEHDLSSALLLNDERLVGKSSAVFKGYPPEQLAYFQSCALGRQMKRLLSWVDESQVHIILHEELEKDPSQVLNQVYGFLDLNPILPTTFERVNEGRVRRYPTLDRITKSLGSWKIRAGITFRFGILSWLRSVNQKKQIRPPLTEEQYNEIHKRMTPDVYMLSRCINRDLSHWLSPQRRYGGKIPHDSKDIL